MGNSEIYTASDIRQIDTGQSVIRANIADEVIDLPFHKVQTPTGIVQLAWVDAKRDEITRAGAEAIARLICEIQPGLLVAPYSSKSGPMVENAGQIANRIMGTSRSLLTLYGGKDKQKVLEDIGGDGWITEYNPVTSSIDKKYVGMAKSQGETIRQHIDNNEIIAILDDVYGTGATVNAVRNTIRMALQVEIADEQLPALVLAREIEGEFSDADSRSIIASIILPVIVTMS